MCVVNAAFSKLIAVKHIEGGGKVNPKRKNLWQKSRNPSRNIVILGSGRMKVNGKSVQIDDWLMENIDLWYSEWNKWRMLVALNYVGDFHWCDDSTVVGYLYNDQLIDFVNWKKECYIKPAYDSFSKGHNRVMEFLKVLYHKKHISLGLVHPKGKSSHAEEAITLEYIRYLYDGDEMCCMPYVVAGYLMNVDI